MFKILQKTFATGIVTKAYPAELAHVSEHFRGRPHFDFEKWTDARPAAEVCPTGAISLRDSQDSREVTVDYGLCVFCGLCAEASSDKAVRITQEFELSIALGRKHVKRSTNSWGALSPSEKWMLAHATDAKWRL